MVLVYPYFHTVCRTSSGEFTARIELADKVCDSEGRGGVLYRGSVILVYANLRAVH